MGPKLGVEFSTLRLSEKALTRLYSSSVASSRSPKTFDPRLGIKSDTLWLAKKTVDPHLRLRFNRLWPTTTFDSNLQFKFNSLWLLKIQQIAKGNIRKVCFSEKEKEERRQFEEFPSSISTQIPLSFPPFSVFFRTWWIGAEKWREEKEHKWARNDRTIPDGSRNGRARRGRRA